MENKIEPCDICGMKYNKEMIKIGKSFFSDNEPCFCKNIKQIERLKKKIKKLEKSNGDYFSYLMDRDDFLSDFLEWQEEEHSQQN